MRGWRQLGLALLVLAPVPPATAADSVSELWASLLPSPRQVSLHGDSRVVPTGPLVLAIAAPADALGWHPPSVLRTLLPGFDVTVRMDVPEPAGGWRLALMEPPAPPPKSIGTLAVDAAKGTEAYRLQTHPGPGIHAVITARGARGLLYGLQTLAQLLGRRPGLLPSVAIDDWPDFGGVRELHVHGFDKGYGAGDFKSLTAFTRDLPAILPHASAGRYNLFRFSLDAAWINSTDRWLPGQDVDAVMRSAMENCRRLGVDALVEVRLQGQRADKPEPDTYPLNPLTEWGYYERALRRALSWQPDVIDFSLNDLGAVAYPDVVAKYGGDGRYSGVLMAELLHKVGAVIREVRPGTRLHHLPRFYGDVHWERHPRAMPDLWSRIPEGVKMYVTSDIAHPVLGDLRRRHGAEFIFWLNYSSNHAKELRVMFTGAKSGLASTGVGGLESMMTSLPSPERHGLLNLGYPIAPQHVVVRATGEMLWNNAASETWAALEKAARQVWGRRAGPLVVQYARLLDSDTIMDTRGVVVADLLRGKRQIAEDEEAIAGAAPRDLDDRATWSGYRRRAVDAQAVARSLHAAVTDAALKQVADILYWNARRVELDARAGELALAGRAAGKIDARAIEDLLREHERVIAEHFPVEPNDWKSAEVVRRGIVQIRQEIRKADGGKTSSRTKKHP